MKVRVAEIKEPVPISVLTVEGDIDGSNYQRLVSSVESLMITGTRALLLDLSGTAYMSTAGLVALQSIAKMLRGEGKLDAEAGWGAIRSIDQDRDGGPQPHFKLLKPQEQIRLALERTGFDQYITIYDDYDEAVASFQG